MINNQYSAPDLCFSGGTGQTDEGPGWDIRSDSEPVETITDQ